MHAAEAYFQIGDSSGDSLVVRIVQPAAIAKARAILAGSSPPEIMTGRVVVVPAFYNPKWHFHVDPLSIGFTESAIEVCDSSIRGIEDGLKDVGRSLLPGLRWCPWTTKVLAEIPAPSDSAQHATHVSAADYTEIALAPGSIVAAFGNQIGGPVALTDSAGTEWNATVLSASPTQVNYILPDGMAPGLANVTIAGATDPIYVQAVAPSLFSITPPGIAAAWITRVRDGAVFTAPVVQDGTPLPIDLGPESDQVYLTLLGTGIRSRSDLSAIQVWIGGQVLTPLYAGPQATYPGVDQINVLLPRSLAGAGTVSVWTVAAPAPQRTLQSEPVQLLFR
jgi:uncharacterized protein (TIGR03437 family)